MTSKGRGLCGFMHLLDKGTRALSLHTHTDSGHIKKSILCAKHTTTRRVLNGVKKQGAERRQNHRHEQLLCAFLQLLNLAATRLTGQHLKGQTINYHPSIKDIKQPSPKFTDSSNALALLHSLCQTGKKILHLPLIK